MPPEHEVFLQRTEVISFYCLLLNGNFKEFTQWEHTGERTEMQYGLA